MTAPATFDLDQNFGFDPSFIRCSSDPKLLRQFRTCKETLLCRRPPSSEVSSYVTRLIHEAAFAERMKYLNHVALKLLPADANGMTWASEHVFGLIECDLVKKTLGIE